MKSCFPLRAEKRAMRTDGQAGYGIPGSGFDSRRPHQRPWGAHLLLRMAARKDGPAPLPGRGYADSCGRASCGVMRSGFDSRCPHQRRSLTAASAGNRPQRKRGASSHHPSSSSLLCFFTAFSLLLRGAGLPETNMKGQFMGVSTDVPTDRRVRFPDRAPMVLRPTLRRDVRRGKGEYLLAQAVTGLSVR